MPKPNLFHRLFEKFGVRQRKMGRAPNSQIPDWPLTQTLLTFGGGDEWTIDAACQGVQIFGSTGSGKSTGVLSNLIETYLRAGFGGLLLTTKPDDAENYKQLCMRTGRSEDVKVFGANSVFRFNPFDSELQRRDAGAGLTQNIVSMLTALLEVSERNQSKSGGDDGGYWQRSNRQLCSNAVELLVLAKDKITVSDLHRLVISAPNSASQLESESWKKNSYCFQCIVEADRKEKSKSKARDFDLVADFFLIEWPNLSEKTRSVVLSTFTSMTDVMCRGLIRDLMSSEESNIYPEMCQFGTIIIVDLPTMVFGDVGVFAAILWKLALQRAQERRDTRLNRRPVFLISDEAQMVAVKQDHLFQTISRSTRTAVILSTQSISNYIAAFGSSTEAEVYSLLGNLQTKFFCQQSDVKTNAYASELIGRSRQFLINAGSSQSKYDWTGWKQSQGDGQTSGGVSECFEWDVQPEVFSLLRKGGHPDWAVDAILHQGGRRFASTGKPWRRVSFRQVL